MLTEIDGLEAAIQIVQRAELPADMRQHKIRGRTSFDTGFKIAKHVIMQELREEQNRRLKARVIK